MKLNDWWRAHYDDGVPIAHILRNQIPDRWLRIHSLPSSKRYPETAQEYAIMLARHNAVAEDVLGIDQPCALFVGRYGEPDATNADEYDLPNVAGANFTLFGSVQEPEEFLGGYEGSCLHLWHAPIVWSCRDFEQLIRSVADDIQWSIMFVSLKTGEAYAPYDGGADLFLSSSARRGYLKHKYRAWLSKHPGGY